MGREAAYVDYKRGKFRTDNTTKEANSLFARCRSYMLLKVKFGLLFLLLQFLMQLSVKSINCRKKQ